ncbi:MAG: glucosamine-6-phosphate deaminase [Clostridia bacterium]
MKVIICKDYQEMSAKAYEYIYSVMAEKNFECILGLATGSTPIGLYKNMVADCKAGNVSYSRMKSVNLDEYIGLPITHDQSYCYFMRDNLFDHIDIDSKNYHLPQGNTADNEKACADYTALLARMQQDVQVLGLGSNGHIGFNEPFTPFDSTTHIVKLTDNTRQDNARFFASLNEVPTHSITMGIANIMNAKSVLVLASGDNKAKAVKAMVEGAVTEEVPASVLQNHKNVVVIVDEKAASLLRK